MRPGTSAAASPIVSVSAKEIQPPIQAARSARSRLPAPMLVPTIATSAPPNPNDSGTSRYSSRVPTP